MGSTELSMPAHLWFNTFVATTGTEQDWHRRNAMINCLALVCKPWWQTVAPGDGPPGDTRLHRRVSFHSGATAEDMRPWWSITRTTDRAGLTDAVLIGLADRCPGLTNVNVAGCSNLTDAAVIGLADRCPGLTCVNVNGCQNLTDAARSRLPQ